MRRERSSGDVDLMMALILAEMLADDHARDDDDEPRTKTAQKDAPAERAPDAGETKRTPRRPRPS